MKKDKNYNEIAFTMIPKKIWNYSFIDAVDRDIYHALLAHRNSVTGLCFPAQGTIGKMVGLHRTNVNKRIAKMAKLGLILKASNGGSCRYSFPHLEDVVQALQASSSRGATPVAETPHKQKEKNKKKKQGEDLLIWKMDGQDNCLECGHPIPCCECH